jgi:hypothetical protein
MKASKNRLLLACFVFIFFAYQLNATKASNSNEIIDKNSPLVEVIHLPDGIIERRYANGTVMHDYSVALQLRTVETWTMTATTTTTFVPPEVPDDQDNPFDYTPLLFLFLCVIGAGTILGTWSKYKSSSRLPKPVERSAHDF